MRSRPLALLVLLPVLAAAPEASATVTSTFSMGTLTVNSDDAGDQITVTCNAITNKVLVNGANPPSGELACNGVTGLGTILVNGNGGNDLIDISGLAADTVIGDSSADGGAGDDQLEGFLDGDVDEMTLSGGPGNDQVISESADFAFGGSGDDRFEGVVQANGKIDGDAGTDTVAWDISSASGALGGVTFAPTNAGLVLSVSGMSQTVPWASIEVADLTLTDTPQTVDGRAFAGRMLVRTLDGADTIYGSEAGDLLDAGPGIDFIEGLGGADVYQGGGGFDRIHARDGIADSGDCGGDDDTLVADAVDALLGCERIELPPAAPSPPPPPPAPDTKKPKLGLKRATLARKLRLAISCPADELRCTGLVTLTGVGKLGKAGKRVKLGALPFSLASGQAKTLVRVLSEKKRDLLDSLAKLRLQVQVDVTDAAGNRTRASSLLAL